jgi:predicted PurR-regulated permease PerM
MQHFSLKRFTQCALIVAALFLLVLNIQAPLGIVTLLFGASAPLIVGCALAYVLNLLLVRIEAVWFPHSRSKLVIRTRRGVCILLSILCLVAIVTAVVQLVLPEFLSSIQMIARDLPLALAAAQEWLIEHSDQFPSLQDQLAALNLNWAELVQKGINLIIYGASGFFNTTMGVLTSVLNVLVTLLIGFIFALYLLFGKERLARQFHRLFSVCLPASFRKYLYYVLDVLNSTFSAFIVGQCTEAVILGILCAVGMTILQLPYGLIVGAVIGVTALIPVAGAYIGGAVGVFLLTMVSPMKALIFLIFLVVLQQLEGNLIYPKVVGRSIGLPGLWVLATVTVAGGILGIPGMLLGVPLAASLYRLLGDFIRGKERKAAPPTPPAEKEDATHE